MSVFKHRVALFSSGIDSAFWGTPLVIYRGIPKIGPSIGLLRYFCTRSYDAGARTQSSVLQALLLWKYTVLKIVSISRLPVNRC